LITVQYFAKVFFREIVAKLWSEVRWERQPVQAWQCRIVFGSRRHVISTRARCWLWETFYAANVHKDQNGAFCCWG